MILCLLLYVKKLVFRKKKYIFVGNLLLRSFHLFRFMQKALVMSDIYMYTFAMINVRNLSDFHVLFRQIYLKTMLKYIYGRSILILELLTLGRYNTYWTFVFCYFGLTFVKLKTINYRKGILLTLTLTFL